MNRIRELRETRGWSQECLGEKIGYSGVAVLHYEKEERRLEANVINKLCDLFDCTADYLLGRSTFSNPTVTKAQADLIQTYDRLPFDIRRAVDVLMDPYRTGAEKKKAK